ncbi:NAD(P)-dependent oxidoreductase [Nesterenkonia alkaliphila]|uniref:Hydroxyacid dehydrogenase n=1 Tax=Nesterenkonia alkaliphila TaxID=1463631 RepID=A0A7K1UJV8_9MICC|nr:NAD(P)-dependent oxidoreductase [Nesterenkonia alkaliphila]MVT26759.1 hydroxyacid dehydrogenase [Nesterenkonia alkaliphila]GFZ77225.1 dihydrofolate reductase [Nesterenkonia alkaliphila]
MRVSIIGTDYPELQDAIGTAGGEVVSDPTEAEGVVVSFAGQVQELMETFQKAPALSWVQLPSAGIERFTEALKERPELLWTSAKGAYALPVAEHALTLTLALLRELPTRVRARSWAAATGTSLHGLKVLVVGAGGVGLEIVRLMKCFDTRVTVVRRLADPVETADATITLEDLDQHLPDTDVVVLAAALTPGTRHLISAHQLGLLPETAVLVNVGRGGLVDTPALVTALQEQKLAGAGLDVTDPEPLPEGHPLWEEPRALITPHAADTLEMIKPLFAARVGENIRRISAGEVPAGVVDAAAGY